MTQRARGEGEDLEQVLRQAVEELLDSDDVTLKLTIPQEVALSSVRVTIEADVEVPEKDGGDDRTEASRAEVDGHEDEEEGDQDEHGEDSSEEEGPSLDEEADAAADFLEGVLDALELPGHLKIRVIDEEDQAEVELVEVESGALIGRRGQTLEAIQELLRSALQRQFQRRSRVKVDVEGYRARRLEKLLEKAEDAIDAVLDSGEPERLEPMDVFERKAVHRLVAQYEGVASRSQGREPARRVVIEPE